MKSNLTKGDDCHKGLHEDRRAAINGEHDVIWANLPKPILAAPRHAKSFAPIASND